MGMTDLSPVGTTWLAWILLVYVVLLMGIGRVAATRVRSTSDYLLAGRGVPLGLSILSLLATWFGSSAMVGTTRSTYEFGMSGTVLEPFACAATLILAGGVFAQRLWRLELATIADLFRSKLGPWAVWIGCAIQVPTFFFWIGAQYLSIGALLESYLGIPSILGIVLSAVVVLAILWSGGMWAVTWTDALLVLVSLSSLLWLFATTAYQLGDGNPWVGVRSVIEQTPPERLSILPMASWSSVLAMIGLFLTGLLGNIPAQDLQQRIQSASSAATARWSCIVAGCLYLIIGLIPIYLGLAAKLHLEHLIAPEDVAGDRVLPITASHFLTEPVEILFVVGLVSLNLAAAGSSTISQTTILAKNVLGGVRGAEHETGGRRDRLPSESPAGAVSKIASSWRSDLRFQQICAVAVTIGSVMAAMSGESVMGLLEISLASVLVSLFVPMCWCLFGQPVGPATGIVPMLIGPLVWGIRSSAEAWQPVDTWPPSWAWYGVVPAEIQGLLVSVIAAWCVNRWLRWRLAVDAS
jgi:solute:Na+ symporter, SSS family